MARVKEFDPDEALAAAMTLFWRQGYAATSTADLVRELSIARASLYATFGSKHELYLRALDRYRRERDPFVVELLSRPGPVLPAVRTLVEAYASEGRGCFVVNAAIERLDEETVARQVRSSWDTVETALTSALLRARAQEELPPSADPRALARFLLVFLQGLRVLGRDDDPERLREAARQALTILDRTV